MSYEIRELSFGEILDMGFTLLRNHFAVLFGIAAVLYLPVGILWAWSVPARGAVPDVQELLAIAVVAIVITSLPWSFWSCDRPVGTTTPLGASAMEMAGMLTREAERSDVDGAVKAATPMARA